MISVGTTSSGKFINDNNIENGSFYYYDRINPDAVINQTFLIADRGSR